MSAALKDALHNCLINFDRRVNVTDLLQKYELTYEEVHKTLEEHLRQQESKGVKYEKRFLIQGIEKENYTEVYTVVQGEKNVEEWLQRLQEAQAALYSVEIAGGSKTPAYAFKPVERHAITLRSLTVRTKKINIQTAPLTNGNAQCSAAEKAEQKPSSKKPTGMSMFIKQSAASGSTTKPNAAEQSKQASPVEKKPSPVKKSSPDTKKISPVENKSKKSTTSAATTSKKGINNFFGAAAKTAPKKEEQVKEEPKSSSPQKRSDMIKKSVEKPKTAKTATKKETPPKPDAKIKANTSVQLFSEDSSDSSDEEEKLIERNRVLVNEEVLPSSSVKRNRIVDSEEEDEPPQKVEKKDSSSECEVVEIKEEDVLPKSETFLDEEGFVITIKSKKTNATKGSNKKSTKTSSPRKTPTKTKATKSQANSKPEPAASKTKQGNIMNFFSKK